MSAVEEIRRKMETRLSDLEAEIESLRSALEALDAQDSEAAAASEPQPKAPRAARARSGPAPARRREEHRANSAELERLLAETGGMDAVELARQTGTDYGQVLARIRELERAGRSG